MLCERLFFGVNDERIWRRLLAESHLEFNKAMELATEMDTPDRNTHDLKQRNRNENPKEPQVNSVTKELPKQPPRNPKQSKVCYRYGG